MWIKHIILENFASINVGMKTNKIFIDFSNRKNKICLLVAPNGYGKTSLLSNLTPFATLGNLDVRDGESLIIKDKDGYKELSLIDNDNEYLIKHFYTKNKDSHSVKSYIMKNGEELNPNGNVTSFKSTVETELGLDMSYLKLIRLGNNVTNMLDLTATERKKFLSNILSELDVYLKLFNKLTDDSRILKTQISHITDKIKHIGIDDLDKAKTIYTELVKEINSFNIERDKLIKDKGIIEHSLSDYDIDDIKYKYSDITNKLIRAKKSLNKYNDKYSLDKANSILETSNNDLNVLDKNISDQNSKLSMLLNRLDDYLKEYNSNYRELTRIKNDDYIKSAKDILHRLTVQLNDEEKLFRNYSAKYTKENIENLILSLIHIKQILDITYEFGKEPIIQVIDLISKNVNVNNYINNGLYEIDMRNNNRSLLLDKFMKQAEDINIECNYHSCGLYKIYIEIKNLYKEEEVIRKNNTSSDFYKYMDLIYQNIMKILDIIKDNKEIIKLLPDNLNKDFLSINIFSNIKNLNHIVDITKYNDLLTEATEYELYLDKIEKCKEAKIRYETLEKNSNIDYFVSKDKELSDNIETTRFDIDSIKSIIEKLNIDKSLLIEKIEEFESLVFALSNLNELLVEEEEINRNLDNYNKLSMELSDVSDKLNFINDSLNKRSRDKDNINNAINTYENLSKDLNHYMKLYNENTYIKKSMSAKEGIPLEYINIYMSNIKNTINSLLDIVYDGDINIEDFSINSNEFRIPYIKNGHHIPDIISASQGETSFLSIALSFAMIYESINKYNIPLLDEMDSNLDIRYREKFIEILEILIDMINAEQVFLISHNNLFSMYPVDIVPLDLEMNDNYKLANYIIPEV
jgi:hypothetical protein